MSRTHYDEGQLRARRKRTFVSSAVIFVLIPLSLWASVALLDNAKYTIISLLIVLYTMLPFFMVFEKRKPKAREVVLIAMMTAITSAVHLFFHMTVPLKIGTALVVIAGISLGPEAGFMIGALSRLVCNFYQGQGPWTPWQMFCWGMMGFLAGVVFARASKNAGRDTGIACINGRNDDIGETGRARESAAKGAVDESVHGKRSAVARLTSIMAPVFCIAGAMSLAYIYFLFTAEEGESFWGLYVYASGAVGLVIGLVLQSRKAPINGVSMAVFTFVTTVIMYGGIMNMAMMFFTSSIPGGSGISLNTLKTLYISGLPYDVSHGAVAAVCAFVIGVPMVEKLERIKIKYGIYR